MKTNIIIMLCLWTSMVYADCGRENQMNLKSSDGKPPRAFVPTPDSVFQTDVEGMQIPHEIEIQNIGDGTLLIRKVGVG